MKRTNVILDEELLEKARQATGEKTYSATIMKGLEEVVRKAEFNRALDEFQREAAKGDFFWPGYLEEMRPNDSVVVQPARSLTSAHEKRVRRTKSVRRGSR